MSIKRAPHVALITDTGKILDAEVAFRAVEPELEALPPEDVMRVNADIPQLVTRVLAAEPRIRATVTVPLPGFSPENVTRLGTCARAAFYAHSQALPTTVEGTPGEGQVNEAMVLRARLFIAADALADRGYFDPAQIAEIKKGSGYRDLAVGLSSLAGLFKANASRIAGKTAVEPAEVDRAQQLSNELLEALGRRGANGAEPSFDASDRRARAYTLMLRTYDQCRRAVTFLRWDEGDADEIAPSLFKGRGGRARPKPAPEPAPIAPAAPAVASETTEHG